MSTQALPRRAARSLVVALIAVAVAAATALPATAAASSAPLKIMVVDSSNSASQPVHDVVTSTAAAAKALNKAGQKIDLETCQPVQQGTTSDVIKCVRQAIDDKVVAFIGNPGDDGMALLEAAKIPVFTPTPLVPSEYNSADSYVTSGGSQVLFGAQGAAMVSQGAKKIAILSFDIDAAKPLAEFAKKAVIGAGGKVVAEIAVPFQAVDVSSQIQQLKSSGADGALLITTEDIGAMIIRTIGQFGVHVKISASQAGLRRETLDSLGSLADGLIGGASLPVVNVGGKNAPSILPYIKEMKAAGSYAADNVRNFGISSWIAVHAIAMAAKDVTGTVDGPTLQSALNASKGYQLPVVGTWVPSKTGPFPTYSRVSNGIGFFLRYEGNGQWATLKPTAGVDTFALVAKADAKAAKAAKAN